MNYLSDKVSSYTGDAISGVNEMRRKWKHTRTSSNEQQQQQQQGPSTSAIDDDDQPTRVGLPPLGLTTTTNTRHRLPQYASAMASRSPLAAGTPFGGDSFTSGPAPAPPIGFRTDLLSPMTTQNEPTSVIVADPTGSAGAQGTTTTTTHEPPERPPRAAKNQLRGAGDSSESLYEADAWARLWFPRVMILCLLRMLLFIRKVYEDFHATKVYNLTGQTGYLMISALTLLLPTLVFTLYRVSRYLQLVLPDLRLAKAASQIAPATGGGGGGGKPSAQQPAQQKKIKQQADEGDDEAQLKRALMTSSPESVASAATPTGGEEGLVTARQSPEAEFHDSQQEPPGLRPIAPAKLESVNVDKLGDLPDKDTVRVVVGASEQFLHGILFVFWQLKRQVDVMGYLVERACLWRKPAEREKEELARLRTGSDGLEWFQDFYAAFLAILAQVYMLSYHWGLPAGAGIDGSWPASRLSAATSGPSLGNEAPTPSSDSARIVSSLLGTQTLAGAAPGERNVFLVSELVVSSAAILSLLICVRRRDDGPLTLGLSMLGWGSLFAGRILAIGVGFVHLGWRVMSPLVVVHVLAIAAWLYCIALASHNDSPSERLDEAEWDPEVGGGGAATGAEHAGGPSTASAASKPAGELELEEPNTSDSAPAKPQAVAHRPPETSSWSLAEHLALLSQITTLFAIPSLFYWPIMFNLKLHLRPFKYLVLVLTENFLLILACWHTIMKDAEPSLLVGGQGGHATPAHEQLYQLGAVAACSVVGFIFVSLYVACKPSLTEYFARADELFNEAEQSGIYYEFCSRVFKMPDLSRLTFRRLMDQSEALIEERYELVGESAVSRSA